MESFLKVLEENYDIFLVTNGEIIPFFEFPKEIRHTWSVFMSNANGRYYKNCTEKKKDVRKFSNIIVEKDQSGKCYLKIVGNDDSTVLIIRQNDSNYEDYRKMIGYKITEMDFIKMHDFIESEKIARAGISSRFIREEPLPMDTIKEMNIPLLISYYRYLNDYINPVENFIEPQGTVMRSPKVGTTTPRKNGILSLDDRKVELLKRNPIKVIRFGGDKTSIKLDAYVYERDGYVLAVVEPESGINYQYDLNLGMIDPTDMELIKKMIKAALEAEEEIVMMDDAIMRKNHTTIEKFSENLDVFLDNAKTNDKFYYDAKNAKNVYHR